MATELDKLVVKIEADLSDLKKGMANANKQVQSSSNKLKKTLGSMGSSFARLGGSALKFGSILGGVFGVLAIKSVVNTGMQIETLEVRLKALFGSAEEGSKAFEKMVEFAGKVPFTLGQIQQGAGALAVVSKDADHLSELMEITGNVASVTGLDFKSASEQIQRSLSSGIASADLFREKGVKNMLGFGNATEVTAKQTAEALQRVFGKGGLFGNATDEMAKTLGGTLSMLGDKLFQFQTAIASTFFETLKSAFGDLNNSLEQNKEQIMKFGEDIGKTLANLVVAVQENFGKIKTAFKVLGAFIAGSVIANIIINMNAVRLAVIGITLVIAGLIEMLTKEIEITKEQLMESKRAVDARREYLGVQEEMKQKITEAITATSKLNDIEKERNETLAAAVELHKDQNDMFKEGLQMQGEAFLYLETGRDKEIALIDKINGMYAEMGNKISTAFGQAVISGKDFKDSMVDIFQSVLQQVVALIFQLAVIEPMLRRIKEAMNAADMGGASMGGTIMAGVKSVFGLGKAGGGSVNANMPYMVGERGAEMFVPKSAGTIVPNNQVGGAGGGNIVIEQNLNFATGVSQTVRAEVMNLLPAIQESTLSAVRDARLRGGSFAKDFGG
tara:strand:- start:6 stop:1853 length:1848 start_codon:yes stop_codon:yes gene_type:complete